MKNNDWGGVFGEVPASFSEKVRSTVVRMQSSTYRAPRHRLALAAAAAIVVLSGTAFALSQFGVLDTLQENLRTFLQPDAARLVQADIAQTARQPAHATFTVEQAVNDGHQIYATVRVHGDDGVLLMDVNADASWPVDWWQDGRSAETYSSRAFDTHRTLVQASVYATDADGNMLTTAAPEIRYDGEDILYTLSFPTQGTTASLQLYTYDIYADDKRQSERLGTGKLDLTVPVTDARTFYAAETPIDLPLGHMTLTRLTVERTPIATYLTCEYVAAEGAPDLTHVRLEDGVWADWLDENGTPYPDGENSNELQQTESGGTRLATVYRAFDTLPGTVTLRFHDGMTGETLDTVTVALHPVDEEGE